MPKSREAARANLENLYRIFTVPEAPDSTLGVVDRAIAADVAGFLQDHIVAVERSLEEIEAHFASPAIPEEPTYVSDYAEFVTARPNFVRLIEREALSDRTVLEGMPLRLAVWQEALAAFRQELGLDISDTSEAAHLLLSLVALTWFPIVHGGTFLKAVGLDPAAPEFAEQRRRHITTLLLGALRERAANNSTWS